MRLTDMSIRSLKAPQTGVVVYSDDTLTGFGVRVSQAGTKAFVLTHGVRRQRETIGRVGIIGHAEARKEAKRRLSDYTFGKEKTAAVAWSYLLWRKAVYQRHDFTCGICGRRGGELQADHMKSFAHYPKLRFEVSNGMTLPRSLPSEIPELWL